MLMVGRLVTASSLSAARSASVHPIATVVSTRGSPGFFAGRPLPRLPLICDVLIRFAIREQYHLSLAYATKSCEHTSMNEESWTVYIYQLVDPRDGSVRYIGQTINMDMRLKAHLNSRNGNAAKYRWVQELRGLGLLPRIEEICRCQCEDADAIELECIRRHWDSPLLFNVKPHGNAYAQARYREEREIQERERRTNGSGPIR
jgi:predicted GIY-YIG superfamily endonuclease